VFGLRLPNEPSSRPKVTFNAPEPSERSGSSGTGVPSAGTGKLLSIPAKMMYLSGNWVPMASVHVKLIDVPKALAVKLVG